MDWLAETVEDLLAFPPVPARRSRHDGFGPARQRAFIQNLAVHGIVSVAARTAGVTPRSAWRLRLQPGAQGFAHAWDGALACAEVVRGVADDLAGWAPLAPAGPRPSLDHP